MMIVNPFLFGMPKVLELLFNAENGGAIIDSTGRHSPSLSPSGTRTIVNNKLYLHSGGFVRADAQNVESSDFDFSTGDWSVECDAFVATAIHIIWNKKTDGTAGLGLALRLTSPQIRLLNTAGVTLLNYDSPTSLVNTQLNLKVERIAGRLALRINGTEVASSTTALGYIDTNGMIIGSTDNAFGAYIDNFVVRKSA